MSTQTQIENFIALFCIQPEQIPKISSETTPPNYTTLSEFQDALDKNAMSIPTYAIDLCHLTLVISDAEFLLPNGCTAFTKPVNPEVEPAHLLLEYQQEQVRETHPIPLTHFRSRSDSPIPGRAR